MDPGFKGEFGEDLAARLEAENAPKQSEIKMEMEECLGCTRFQGPGDRDLDVAMTNLHQKHWGGLPVCFVATS
jgi:hypothetical protein